jgi:hypothetical protein
MSTYELAEKASDSLSAQLGNPAWLLGVGVGKLPDGNYTVEVRLSKDAPPNVVQSIFMNVPVVVRTATMPYAQ